MTAQLRARRSSDALEMLRTAYICKCLKLKLFSQATRQFALRRLVSVVVGMSRQIVINIYCLIF